jgi:hypothetical protein
MGSVTVSADVFTYTISDLADSTRYSITVQALNMDPGDGTLSPGNVVLEPITTTPGKPTDPWGITLNDVATSSSVWLTWQDASANGGSPIDNYTITWQPPDAGGTFTTSTNVSSAYISDLLPGSRYTFAITTNAGSNSSPGVATFSSATTPSNGLNDPSGFMTGLPPTAVSFSLQWNKVKSTNSVTLCGYTITWQPPDGDGNGMSNFDDTRVSATIVGLEPSTSYNFNIYAIGQDADMNTVNSPGNFYVKGSTTYAGGLRAPYDLAIDDKNGGVSSHTVVLEWYPARPSGAEEYVEFYTITAVDASTGYVLPTQSTPSSEGPDGATTSLTFTNLSAGTDYLFSVFAQTNLTNTATGIQPEVLPVTTAAAGGPLDPVLSVPNGGVTANTISINWEPSDENGGSAIARYILTWQPPDGVGHGQKIINGPGFNSYKTTINGLSPDTGYTFNMVAVNLSGTPSPGQQNLSKTTLDTGGPADPTGLRVNPNIPATANSISVVWNSAYVNGGADIDYYTLFVSGNEYDTTFKVFVPNTTFTIPDLTASTPYLINITATNKNGKTSPGEQKPIAALTAVAGGPGDPGFVEIVRSGSPLPTTDSNIQIAWNTASKSGGSDISGYIVTWK